MNFESIKTLSLTKAKKLMRELKRVLEGKDMEDSVSEGVSSLEFPELKAEVDRLDMAASKDLLDYKARARLNYAYVTLRDAKYSYAGRRHSQSLALHNTIREAYERGRLAINSREV